MWSCQFFVPFPQFFSVLLLLHFLIFSNCGFLFYFCILSLLIHSPVFAIPFFLSAFPLFIYFTLFRSFFLLFVKQMKCIFTVSDVKKTWRPHYLSHHPPLTLKFPIADKSRRMRRNLCRDCENLREEIGQISVLLSLKVSANMLKYLRKTGVRKGDGVLLKSSLFETRWVETFAVLWRM